MEKTKLKLESLYSFGKADILTQLNGNALLFLTYSVYCLAPGVSESFWQEI